jgi:hypothetical protein
MSSRISKGCKCFLIHAITYVTPVIAKHPAKMRDSINKILWNELSFGKAVSAMKVLIASVPKIPEAFHNFPMPLFYTFDIPLPTLIFLLLIDPLPNKWFT